MDFILWYGVKDRQFSYIHELENINNTILFTCINIIILKTKSYKYNENMA